MWCSNSALSEGSKYMLIYALIWLFYKNEWWSTNLSEIYVLRGPLLSDQKMSGKQTKKLPIASRKKRLVTQFFSLFLHIVYWTCKFLNAHKICMVCMSPLSYLVDNLFSRLLSWKLPRLAALLGHLFTVCSFQFSNSPDLF